MATCTHLRFIYLRLAAIGSPGLQLTVADTEAVRPAGVSVSPTDVDAVVVGGDAKISHGELLLCRCRHLTAAAAATAEGAGGEEEGRPEEVSRHLRRDRAVRQVANAELPGGDAEME